MEFYLDTALLHEIREVVAWGVLGGITTNPSHVAKAGVRDLRSHIQEMCWIADVPISVEVVTLDADEMVEQGLDYATWSPNVVVKLPTVPEGLKAMAKVTKTPVTATCTGCPHFEGRLDAIGADCIALVADIAEILRVQGQAGEIIAAAIRHPMHVTESARAGAQIATMAYDVLTQLIQHPLTEQGLASFMADYERSKQ